jgi:hypothetical protein
LSAAGKSASSVASKAEGTTSKRSVSNRTIRVESEEEEEEEEEVAAAAATTTTTTHLPVPREVNQSNQRNNCGGNSQEYGE